MILSVMAATPEPARLVAAAHTSSSSASAASSTCTVGLAFATEGHPVACPSMATGPSSPAA